MMYITRKTLQKCNEVKNEQKKKVRLPPYLEVYVKFVVEKCIAPEYNFGPSRLFRQ